MGIEKYYGSLHVLKGVGLTLYPGEIVSLVGASGAGKSTLLQILGTLDKPDRGNVIFEGQSVLSLSSSLRAKFRKFNALENVSLPGYISGRDKAKTDKRAMELLDYLGLADRKHHKPSALSGGEQQRVAVARALINDPRLILADEPTGNLDSANSELLYNLFKELARDFQVAFLITTHNETLAKAADRCVSMKDGLVEGIQEG
ncbi:UNVERIFIED_CONTAM: hypothetical protein GTU68_057440 [Idotea baltica]|nr:hypothetical protein [Idotea baltica]